jgi:hypothetical protein
MLDAIQNLPAVGFVREARGIQRHKAHIESCLARGWRFAHPFDAPRRVGETTLFPAVSSSTVGTLAGPTSPINQIGCHQFYRAARRRGAAQF